MIFKGIGASCSFIENEFLMRLDLMKKIYGVSCKAPK
jgi:hypothetical protein